MAPFLIFNPQPHIEPRRASPDQITLSVTHESTTYTTTIALGPATAATSDTAPTPTTFLTTATLSAPTQTAQATLPRSNSSSSPDTGVVVGAVLGSILGTAVLITLLYKCCFDNRSAAWIPTFSSYDSDTDSERSSRSSRVHRRGGGGDGFGRDNKRGDRVRRPRRAETRRRRRREESASQSERSWSTRRERRRTSGMSKNDGLLGWFLVPRTTPYRYTERKHTRSSWAGGGGRGSTADD